MKQNLYTLYDKLGKEYCPPFVCGTHEQAIRRTVISIVQSRSIQTDFELFWIGTYETTSAVLKAGKPVRISFEDEWSSNQKTIENMLFDVNSIKSNGLKPWPKKED